MKTLNTQLILAEATRLILAHVPEGEISDKVLDGLIDLQRSLPERMQAAPEKPLPHMVKNPHAQVEAQVEDWIKRNGNPRLEPELRALADAIGDIEL